MDQDHHRIRELCQALEAAKGGKKGGKKAFSCKKSTFPVAGSAITVDSWRFQDWDYKRDDLPTYARGLFTTKRSDGKDEIAIRGYDKFFNVGEVPSTQWAEVEANTVGPYELSVKENGCIIFMSGLEDGTLLVCSKHSTGARQDTEQSHAMVGERWVKTHLEAVGKTTRDLARALRDANLTAVAELCDDEFEEHVLEYPPHAAGLYLHGLNYNLPEFATMSGAQVHAFADGWGFKKAQYVSIDSIDQVRSFLDKCAETGSWEGRDTEGFVVRCKIRGSKSQLAGPDWFFKFKFEEPYLMYRQWREATKAIIANRPPKYRKHKKITEEYLLFARRRLARNPKLAALYNQNHGIIKMRTDFLAEKGQNGAEIIRQEADEGAADGEDAANIVLVPIATIGCGKTTIATALVKLFDFGHVQNDNIEGQKGRPQRFANEVMTALALHKAVIADRNNHQKRERKQIIEDVQRMVPDAKFVALHYVHEPKSTMLEPIRRVTRERVLDRGDNHQTIRASSKGQSETIGIMDGFLHRFQACDPTSDPDDNFDQVINLDVTASSLDNLDTVITQLYNAYPRLFDADMPTQDDMQDAIDFAMNSQVTTKHDLLPQLVKKLAYFSVSVPKAEIDEILADIFAGASPEEARMYNYLRESRRIQARFHVTLIHRASISTHQNIWEPYVNAFTHALSGVDLADKAALVPVLGTARVRLERLVWDDRIMAIVVRVLPAPSGETWPSANSITHITVGTSSPEVKPKESNDLLAFWEAGHQGRSTIWEREVPGMPILQGEVEPVYQPNPRTPTAAMPLPRTRHRVVNDENAEAAVAASTRLTRAKAATLETESQVGAGAAKKPLQAKKASSTSTLNGQQQRRKALGDVTNASKGAEAVQDAKKAAAAAKAGVATKPQPVGGVQKLSRTNSSRAALGVKDSNAKPKAAAAAAADTKKPASGSGALGKKRTQTSSSSSLSSSTAAAASLKDATPDAEQPPRKKSVTEDLVRESRTDEAYDCMADLDAEDLADPSMCAEYVREIFEYYHELEKSTMPNANYMEHQDDLEWKMRGILVDWLIEVHIRFRLLPETLFLAVNIVDRFLSSKIVPLDKLQLVGITAMFIASKYEEVLPPHVGNFVHVADDGFTVDEVLSAERYTLSTLKYDLSYPNPMNFLRRISKADNYDIQTRTIGKYLMEISLVDHRFLEYRQSHVAAASMYLARMILDRGEWGPTLCQFSGYTEQEILPVFELLVDYLRAPVAHEALFKKYASKKFLKASILTRKWAKDYCSSLQGDVSLDGVNGFQ
ncbi:hypothetical protein DV737_g3688, partial [Chaetothyriales sp. CBS 132003]